MDSFHNANIAGAASEAHCCRTLPPSANGRAPHRTRQVLANTMAHPGHATTTNSWWNLGNSTHP